MSIKLNKKQLKQIIIEELEEIRADGRGFGPAQLATAKALSNKGIATRPESVRTRLMQLVAGLDLKNPTQEEIRQLADMVSDLMDAAQDADAAGLEEVHNELQTKKDASNCGSYQKSDNRLIVYIKEELQKYLEERYSQKGK